MHINDVYFQIDELRVNDVPIFLSSQTVHECRPQIHIYDQSQCSPHCLCPVITALQPLISSCSLISPLQASK